MALGSKNVLNEGTNNISVGSERIFKKVQMLFLPQNVKGPFYCLAS